MKLLRFYLPAIAWTAIILFLTLLPASDVPNTVFSRIPHFDKMVHAGIFTLFVILWYSGSYKSFSAGYKLKQANENRQYHPLTVLAWVVLAAILLGLLIEVVQKEWTTLHRDFEWFDWLADAIGAFFGGAIVTELYKIKFDTQE